MKKRVLSLIICMVLALPMIQTPILAGATEATEDTSGPVEKEEVSQHIAAGTYPTKTDSVFAGWYKDADYTNPVTGAEDIPEDGAYAKFVDEKVLSVKLQLTEGTTSTSPSTNLRLITSVDSRKYEQVGFKVQVESNDEISIPCDKVYDTIYGYVDGENKNYTPAGVFENTVSEHFATKIVTGVANVAFSRNINVTPFWTTLDGTTVTGTERTIVISELLDKYYKLDLADVEAGAWPSVNGVSEITNTSALTVKQDEKYINVVDDNSSAEEGIIVEDVDFSSGVKTITFDLRTNKRYTTGVEANLYIVNGGTQYVCAQFGKNNQYYDIDANDGTGSWIKAYASTGKWDSVVLVVDGDNDNFTLYYNGELMAEDVTFRSKTSVGTADIQLYTQSTGSDIDIRNLVIYEADDAASSTEYGNVYYKLDLSSVTSGAWTGVNGVSAKTNTSALTVKQDAKYINVVDDNADANEGIKLTGIDFSSGVKTITFDLRTNERYTTGGVEANLDIVNGSTNYVRAQFGGKNYYHNGSSFTAVSGCASTGNWDSVVLVVDGDKDTYSLYYNGTVMIENQAFIGGAVGTADIRIFGQSTGSNIDIRNLVIYNGDKSVTSQDITE